MSTQGTRQGNSPLSRSKGGHSPGARFAQNDRHYVVVDDRLVPHVVESDYIIDQVYIPGHGTLCCCIETGELVRLTRGSYTLEEEWEVLAPKDPDETSEIQTPDPDSATRALTALGLRRKR